VPKVRPSLLRALPWLILIVAMGLSLAIWESNRLRGRDLARVEFDLLVTRLSDSIQRRMVANEQVLRSVEGLFDASKDVSREEFRTFVAAQHLEKNYPGIQGIGFSRLIRPAELAAHVARIRGEGFSRYELRPPGARDIYSSIIYLEPFDWRNQRAFGYDMYSEPVRHKAMLRAAETGAAALSGMVTLVQETEKDVQAGVLLYIPIYSGAGRTATLEERKQKLIGWAYSPLRMKDMIQGLLQREHADLVDRIALRIHDGREASAASLMFDSGQEIAPVTTTHTVERRMALAGQEWTLVARTLPGFHSSSATSGERSLLAAELAIIWLAAILAITMIHGRLRMAQAMEQLAAANREIDQRRKWLQSVFDASSVGIFMVDPQGVITVANRRMAEIFGRSIEALQGAEYVSLIHPLERESGRVNMQRLLTSETSQVDIERRYWRGDRTEFWGHLTGRRVSESDGLLLGLAGVIADITPRRLAEQALRESEERYRLIAENSSDVIWLLDLVRQRFTYVSPAIERMRGWSPEEIMAMPLSASVTPETAERVISGLQQRLRRFVAGEAVLRHSVIELEQPCKDGHVITVEVATSILTAADGSPSQMLGITRDITERKRIEAELEQHRNHLEELVASRTEDLATALDAAEAASRAKSVFLANMSHELRTPMNAIMGMTNLALRKITEPRTVEQLNKSLAAARHLLALIDNVLDIANFEAGRVVLNPAPFSLARLVDDALQAQDSVAGEKGLTLVAEIAPGLADALIGDAGRLKQILLNFLGNAVKFSEQGEIRLAVRSIEESSEGVLLRFEVADQGIGLTAEARDKLFQLFSQGDEASTRMHGGTGLGLVIARRIARLMGGDVGVDSSEEGSRFWVTVRLQRGE
jgi:PAS domain S-box-containing protein